MGAQPFTPLLAGATLHHMGFVTVGIAAAAERFAVKITLSVLLFGDLARM